MINLDGVVNDARFFREVVVGGDLEGYLAREMVVWIAEQGCNALSLFLGWTGSARLAERLAPAASFYDAAGPGCPRIDVWRLLPSHAP